MLVPGDGPGDLPKGSALVNEGLSVASDLGMKPLVGRLQGISERLVALRRSYPRYPDGLSEREVEVLRLIAAGKTNRQIAEELMISSNTVIRHVNNIFNKTDVSNRAEAASYATHHGLV